MPEVLQTLVPYVVGGMFLLAALLFVIALWNFRRGRREPYWRLRRDASQHGWQLFVVAVTMSFLAAAVCLFSGFAQAMLGGAEPTALSTEVVIFVTATLDDATLANGDTPPSTTRTPTSDASPTATRRANSPTPVVTTRVAADDSPTAGRPTTTPEARTATPTRTPTQAATPSPTRAATATETEVTAAMPLALDPLAASVTPLAEATLEITAVDDQLSEALEPVTPRDTLDAGVRRVYFWLNYDGMTDGVAWERALLLDGVPVQGGAYLWSGGETGRAVYFFGDTEGFAAGSYEIQVSLAGDVVASHPIAIE